MTRLLEVRDLAVSFDTPGGEVRAVRGVSFDIDRGETVALVGESGSGKSTLGRAIIGLVPILSGTVRFDGREPLGQGAGGLAAYRRHVAMMFQDPVASLSPRLIVKSLITEPFLIHGLRDKDLDAEARRLLALVGLPGDFVGRYPQAHGEPAFARHCGRGRAAEPLTPEGPSLQEARPCPARDATGARHRLWAQPGGGGALRLLVAWV